MKTLFLSFALLMPLVCGAQEKSKVQEEHIVLFSPSGHLYFTCSDTHLEAKGCALFERKLFDYPDVVPFPVDHANIGSPFRISFPGVGTYCYTVKAYNDGGYGPPSDEICIEFVAPPVPPAPSKPKITVSIK